MTGTVHARACNQCVLGGRCAALRQGCCTVLATECMLCACGLHPHHRLAQGDLLRSSLSFFAPSLQPLQSVLVPDEQLAAVRSARHSVCSMRMPPTLLPPNTCAPLARPRRKLTENLCAWLLFVCLQYAEMEMRHRFVNHARNVWDR